MTTQYISCACNRVPHVADWGTNGLVCYGACNSIAVYDPEEAKTGKVLYTLHRHKARVNVVKWIKMRDPTKPECELLSASSDGTVIIWTKLSDGFQTKWILETDGITTIASALYLPAVTTDDTSSQTELLICAGTVNGNFKLWRRSKDGIINCFQTIRFGSKLATEASLTFLPCNKIPLLAVAMEDSTIQLFSCNSSTGDEESFVKNLTLVGHEDWIRCMDFAQDGNGDILLASGSQDSTIRLWRITMEEEELKSDVLQQKKQFFLISDRKYSVMLESVFSGHEGWVYGINWHPLEMVGGWYRQPMKLLSCSLDKSMIIWEPDATTGIWLESIRVGEVGGNSLGFYGCKFGPKGQSILAHGYQGAFHLYKYSPDTRDWFARNAASGHFAEVVDLCWDPKGRFLITASADQTTRIHAPWKQALDAPWHEIGRAQIHGYDMSCLAMLTPYMFASGAEEKVVRTFSAPATFLNYLRELSHVDDFVGNLPESAMVPALGLTNKAVFEGGNAEEEALYTGYSKDLDYEKPPTEEELIRHTLWPEVQKLYGHGYELFSMAARHDGSLLATACKSANPQHSAIILWSTKTWSQVQKLEAHQLTVTQLAFSPNDNYLLSVSRDRRWSLFRRNVDDAYDLIVASARKDILHARIIWCCAWTHDSKYYATGSRDGRIGIWNPLAKNIEYVLPSTSLEIKEASVTALSFAPSTLNGDSYVLAIGFDSGCIEIQKIVPKENEFTWRKYKTFDTSQAHHSTVKRLAFQPQCGLSTDFYQLASCGSDHAVKIFTIDVRELADL